MSPGAGGGKFPPPRKSTSLGFDGPILNFGMALIFHSIVHRLSHASVNIRLGMADEAKDAKIIDGT
jgi:hypothetical protein